MKFFVLKNGLRSLHLNELPLKYRKKAITDKKSGEAILGRDSKALAKSGS